MYFRLEDEGDFERAAAIAVFRVKIRQAIEVLHKGAEVQTGNQLINSKNFKNNRMIMKRQFICGNLLQR